MNGVTNQFSGLELEFLFDIDPVDFDRFGTEVKFSASTDRRDRAAAKNLWIELMAVVSFPACSCVTWTLTPPDNPNSTRWPARGHDCNRSTMAGFAAAQKGLGGSEL